ncbi:hypothetical protein DMP32_00795 [Brucella abortus]|nr:hypothetical protein DMP32_00795 [Brucella abortus]
MLLKNPDQVRLYNVVPIKGLKYRGIIQLPMERIKSKTPKNDTLFGGLKRQAVRSHICPRAVPIKTESLEPL